MSPPEQPNAERLESKSGQQEEIVKSTLRSKVKRDKVLKNIDTKANPSNFHRYKSLGLLKRNTAQDRLKRIRAAIALSTKAIDGTRSEKKTDVCDEGRNLSILSEKCLLDHNNVKKKHRNEVTLRYKYSADSRLKKIRATFTKKISNSKRTDAKTVFNDSGKKLENNVDHLILINELNEKKTVQEDQNAALETDASMDIDAEPDCNVEAYTTDDSNCFNIVSPELKDTSELESLHVANEISKFRHERTYLALHESFAPDFTMNLAVPSGDLFIVIDTNIFLSDLSFVKKLLSCDIHPYKHPVIVISWLVLQEIDYASKKKDAKLSSRAKAANTFIYECLKNKHPRVFGQSLEDFKQTFSNAVCIDDFILQYCLKFISLENNVILLTNDINLCSKSMVNNLNVFTKNEFQLKFSVTNK